MYGPDCGWKAVPTAIRSQGMGPWATSIQVCVDFAKSHQITFRYESMT